MAISRADFGFPITAMCTRNPNLGIRALEDELFANLLFLVTFYYFVDLYIFWFVFRFLGLDD